MREMQARQDIENILIVCPKALVLKWKAEMKRFDEDFHVITPENLRYCIDETRLDGMWPAQFARGIVSLELLRNSDYLNGKGKDGKVKDSQKSVLLTLDPPPRFSLVIFDEAHHLRNHTTNSYEAAEFLCRYEVSEAVLFLSATPVHLGSENLYTLLNLLRPDLLRDFATFQQMIEPNAHIIRSMRHIRTRMPADNWQGESLSALAEAENTEWGRQAIRNDPRIIEWRKRLSHQTELDSTERVRCLRDLEEVQSFSHLMNRTRRRDIGKYFTIREPHTVEVPFTEKQMAFYKEIVDFRQQMLSMEHNPLVVRLIKVNFERQTASCLPALLPMLDKFILTGRFVTSEYTDDLENENTVDLPPIMLAKANKLRELADNLPPEDPKLERLKKIINTVLSESRPRKVLVFSYFLHTLDYLKSNLVNCGIRVELVTGKIDDDERERLRGRFRLPNDSPDAIDILLSSEVGCEGLDYEFCDCLVNYDIPWNPMKIEQRIGRIDRFGQQSDKVYIYNFITPGTVEERIIYRCFERLDIFRNTVGDNEEILAELTKELEKITYESELSLEQAEERALQIADNALRHVEEQRRLEENSEALLGLEQSFIEDVDNLIKDGRFVSQNDLAHMVKQYVEQYSVGGGLTQLKRRPVTHRLRLKENARKTILSHVQALKRFDRTTVEFDRWLRGSEPRLELTFDQKTALEQRDLPFITPIHPLAKAAIGHWNKVSEPLVARLLIKDPKLRNGLYFFVLELWETVAARSEVRLKTFVWDVNRQEISKELLSLLPLFERESDLQDLHRIKDINFNHCLESVDEYADRIRLYEVEQLKQRNDRLLDQQLASLRGYHQNRLDRVETELNQSMNERIRIMKRSEKRGIEIEYERKQREIEKRRNCDIVVNRIALGVIRNQSE